MVALTESEIGICTSKKNILKYIISTMERVLYLIFQYDNKILKHNICIQFHNREGDSFTNNNK